MVHLLIESAKYNIRIELTCLSVTLFAVAALGKKRAIQATQLMRTLGLLKSEEENGKIKRNWFHKSWSMVSY